jgi:hypothetical protein
VAEAIVVTAIGEHRRVHSLGVAVFEEPREQAPLEDAARPVDELASSRERERH